MKVSANYEDGVLRLALSGDDALDYNCAQSVRREVLAAIDDDSDVLVDLSGIEFIDSAGLGVLVTIYKAVRRAGRRSVFAGIRPPVRNVLRVIKLDSIFDLAEDRDAALETLSG